MIAMSVGAMSEACVTAGRISARNGFDQTALAGPWTSLLPAVFGLSVLSCFLARELAVSPPHSLRRRGRRAELRGRALASGPARVLSPGAGLVAGRSGHTFRDRIATDGLLGEIPAGVWTIEWNVNCQPTGDGSRALQYLAPYVFKVAIGERRLLAVDAPHVRFRYQKPHSHRVRTMTLPIMECMRRFLQHVLPRGFMKARYYGFLSPSASVPLEDVKARIEMASGCALAAPEAPNEPPAALRRRHCGGALRCSRLLLAGDSALGGLVSRPANPAGKIGRQ